MVTTGSLFSRSADVRSVDFTEGGSARLFVSSGCRHESRLFRIRAIWLGPSVEEWAPISSFDQSMGSRYVRKQKTDSNRGIDAMNPNGNDSKRSPTAVGKPLSLGEWVGILKELWLTVAIWEMSVYESPSEQTPTNRSPLA